MKKLLLKALNHSSTSVDGMEVTSHKLSGEEIPKYFVTVYDPNGTTTPRDVGKLKADFEKQFGCPIVLAVYGEETFAFELYEVTE